MIQPTDSLPPNCSFVREDSTEPWVFDKLFDYIHWRFMVTCCTCLSFPPPGQHHTLTRSTAVESHKDMIFKVFDNLNPGGWAEFQDYAWELVGSDEQAEAALRASALWRCWQLVISGGAGLGRDFQAPLKYARWMKEAGFVDIVVKEILAPVNAWPLDPLDRVIGGWYSLDVQKGVKGLAKVLEAAGMTPGDIPAFTDEVCENVTMRTLRAYSPRKWLATYLPTYPPRYLPIQRRTDRRTGLRVCHCY